MTRKLVEFHEAAHDDIEAAVRWYRPRSKKAAAGLLVEIDRAIARLSEHPEIGPVATEFATSKTIRKVPLRKYPYIIFYTVDRTVKLLAIAHAARRPGYWLDRTT